MYSTTKEELTRIKRSLEETQRIAHLGSWEWNIEESSVYWSDEAFRIYGYEPQSFIPSYESYINAVHIEDRFLAEKNLQEALGANGAFAYEQRIIRPNGEMRIILNQGEVYLDNDKKPKYVDGTILDITERKKREESANQLADFKNIILNLSMHLINTPISELRRSLINAMEIVGKYCSADSVVIYQYDWERQIAVNLYKWNAEHHIASTLEEIPMNEIDLIIKGNRTGEISYRDCINECFFENDLGKVDSKLIATSAAIYPLTTYTRPIGFLSVARTDVSNQWPLHFEEMVQVFSEMLSAVLKREERENALSETEENVSHIFDSTNDAIAMFDYEGHILNINDAYCTRLGVQRQDVIGAEYKYFFPEERYGDTYERRMQKIHEVFDAGKPIITLGFRDGMTFDNRLFPVYKKGKVSAVALFSTDITDRKKAEEETRHNAELSLESEILRKKENEYLEILDGSAECSYIYDFQNGILEYSKGWLKRIGGENVPITELNNFTKDLIHPDDLERMIQEIKLVFKTNETKIIQEFRLKTISDGYIWILNRGKYQYDENKKPVKFYGAALDITDRKMMEEELKKTADELASNNKILQEQTKELQTAYEQLASYIEELQETADLRAREKLMHELHDKLGHILATASIGVQAVDVLIRKDIGKAKERLDMVAQQIQEAMQSLRTMISTGTISIEKDETSFVQSITNLMIETEKRTSVSIKRSISENTAHVCESLSLPLRSFIYNALLEGLTNGLRHGGVTEYKFELTSTHHKINFRLKDNGGGCNDIKYGYGLSQIQRCAKRFGAKVETNGRNGFKLEISIPLIYQTLMEV